MRVPPSHVPRGRPRRGLAGAASASLLALALAAPAVAAEPVDLGAAGTYSVLAPSLTSNGPTAMSEDLGSSVAVAGDAAPIVLGQTRIGAGAAPAQADLDLAYGDAVLRPGVPFAVADLAGATLTPGVYYSTAAMGFTAGGTLTLDGGGDPDAVFILQIGGALTVGASAQVALVGDADPCNVFWAVNGATTIGATSRFAGTVMADLGITVGAGSRVDGRLLADTAAITLASTAVRTACAATVVVPGPAGPAGPTGPAGVDGADGADGATGPAGPAGAAGPTGLTGPIGPTGLIGLMGPVGAAGSPGPRGLDGLAGPAAPVAGTTRLCVTHRAAAPTVRPGGRMRWTTVVRNCGPVTADGVTVTARPGGRATTHDRGGGRIVRGGVTWDAGALAPGVHRVYRTTVGLRTGTRPGRLASTVVADAPNSAPAVVTATTTVTPGD
jgi:hypothetical protein